jgi:excisionase family DNA binding protein
MDRVSSGSYTVQEVADILGISPDAVRALIRTKVLPAKKVAGRYRISVAALASLIPNAKPAPKRSRAVMARRHILTAGATIGLGLATNGFYDIVKEFWTEHQRENEAVDRFRRIFGHVTEGGREFDYSLGRPKYRGRYHPYHPDNWVAGVALGGPLGLPDIRNVVPPNTGIRMNLRGDVFVIGGSSSTDETMVAWELEGPNDQELRRRANPILPLRWYGMSDINDPATRSSPPIAYRYPDGGPRATAAWPIVEVDTKTGRVERLWTPGASKETLRIKGRDVSLPYDNYLYLSRLANFLDDRFDATSDRNQWPHLLVIGGSNGIGTRVPSNC